MDKRMVTAVVAVVLTIPALAIAGPVAALDTLHAWTVMVYMDGDNDIEAGAIADLEEMMQAGSDGNVNVVALVDTFSGPANLLYLENGAAETTEAWGEVAMDEGATLERFIVTAQALYPAERTALVLWNHGGGVLGICWDDTSGADEALGIPELGSALDNVGADFDLLVFNACLMAQAEIAFEVADHADTLVFSEDIMSLRGFEWTTAVNTLKGDPGMDGTSIGLVLAQNYATNNEDSMGSLFTMSVCSSEGVLAVADALATAASAQSAALEDCANALKECRNTAEEVEAYGPVDIVEYMSNVAGCTKIADQAVRATAVAVVAAVQQAILFHWHLRWVDGLNGLGVYFPRNNTQDEWYVIGEKYSALPFCEYTAWDDFLDAFYAA